MSAALVAVVGLARVFLEDQRNVDVDVEHNDETFLLFLLFLVNILVCVVVEYA